MQRAVVRYKEPPEQQPRIVVFHFPSNFLTHRYVLDRAAGMRMETMLMMIVTKRWWLRAGHGERTTERTQRRSSTDDTVHWPQHPTRHTGSRQLDFSVSHCMQERCMLIRTWYGGTAAAVPPPFRPGKPALCGSHPLVTPYWCRLGDLLCFVFMYDYCAFLLIV